MANYCATARSNYFRVKSKQKFLEWVASIPSLGVWEEEEPANGWRGRRVDWKTGSDYFAICSSCPDSGSWPSVLYCEETDECTEIDVLDELSKHLDEGSTAVLFEVGAEKMRYVHGSANAVNSVGDVKWVTLDFIYSEAKETLGGEITKAEY